MIAIRIAPLLFSLAALPPATAQPQTTPPHFDVASLKPGAPLPPGNFNINLGSLSHGTLTLTNTTLADCLRYAYGLTSNDEISAPDWVKQKTVRFDIIAKAPADTPLAQVRLMLQTLLAERFELKLHREQKQMSYLALAPGKSAPKFQGVSADADGAGSKYLVGHIESKRTTMNTLVTILSRYSGQTILDRTGLTGFYDLKLTWTPESRPEPLAAGRGSDMAGHTAETARDSAAAAVPAESNGPPLAAAIEKQLGLKLEVRKGPVEIIVIDHADEVPIQN